jgi:hypothetical protein
MFRGYSKREGYRPAKKELKPPAFELEKMKAETKSAKKFACAARD